MVSTPRVLSLCCAFGMLLGGCRGEVSERPPLRPIDDMRNQPKYRPEGASRFFADGRAMRPPVEGTLARGELIEPANELYRRGRDERGYVERAPVEMTRALMARGRERFEIYCAACHDRTGGGRGMVVQRGYPPPVELTSERVRTFTDGEIFEVMSKGVRNMPSHAAQIPVEDRWAIVGWVRALQRSQHASVKELSDEERAKLEPETP